MLLEVKFNVFKEIVEDFRKKTQGISTRVHYYESDDSFVCYFSTPDWKYLTNPKKADLNPTDIAFVIKSGVRIERRVKDTPDIFIDNETINSVKSDLIQLETRLMEQFEELKDG